jgi:hypothetical protein
MSNKEIKSALESLELFLAAHPDNQDDSEMRDRLTDVREMINDSEPTEKVYNKSQFEYLRPGLYARIRHSVYNHFSKAKVLKVDGNNCLLNWDGTEVWRHKSDFNCEPLLFCA